MDLNTSIASAFSNMYRGFPDFESGTKSDDLSDQDAPNERV